MPVNIPNFTTSAVINGNTLISQADEQLNILMTDVENYVESTYQTVATNLEGTVGIHVTTASNFATSALSSANSADISEANALNYKNSAQTHATNVGISEANALSYKNSAQASADSATISAYGASVNAATIANNP